jgi:group I intron endonuclease
MKALIIYTIRNVVDQKFYVGSTANMRERFRTHRGKLRREAHHCHHQQAAWTKYGEEAFKFEVVERLSEEASYADLQAAEDVWLEKHVGTKECYNHGLRSGAPWRGCRPEDHPNYGNTMPEEQKTVLSNFAKQQWLDADPRTGTQHSEEAKVKISAKVQAALAEGRGGKFIPSEETRRKMSEALKGNQCAKGYKRTPEEIEKIRERTKGNQNWLGKSHSEESKLKMSKGVLEVTTGVQFQSLTAVLKNYEMTMPTLRRALLSGAPITKGRYKGLHFRYLDTSLQKA